MAVMFETLWMKMLLSRGFDQHKIIMLCCLLFLSSSYTCCC